MTVRDAAAAAIGLANEIRNGFSRANPLSPTGIVATTRSHERRSVGVSILQARMPDAKAVTIRAQSLR